MSIRIHVGAVRNVPASELKEELRGLGDFDLEEAGGWVWFSASVWGIDADALLKRLETLPRTTMLVTTQDGCRWYLRLRKPGEEPYDLCHEFGFLDSGGGDLEELYDSDDDYGDDDADDDADGWSIGVDRAQPGSDADDDTFFNEDAPVYEDEAPANLIEEIIRDKRELFGCPLPEGVEEHLRTLAPGEAVAQLCAWESAGLLGALKRFGVPHDADEVASIMLGETVTEAELESDLGNLPRLLAALGLGEYWDVMVEETAGEYDEDFDDSEFDEDDSLDEVLRLAKDCAAAPVVGGPVDVPLEKAPAVALLSMFCDTDASFVLRITPGASPVTLRPAYFLTMCERADDGLDLGPLFGEPLSPREMRRLGERLKELPSGTLLEMVCAGSELSAGIHRYSGRIADGHWRIDAAAPNQDAAILREALALAVSVADGAELHALDEAEATAVTEASRYSEAFEDLPLYREGLLFQTRRAQLETLAQLLFRQRFRGHWNVEEGEQLDEELHAIWMESRREMEEVLGIPYTGRIVFEGRASRYAEVDLDALKAETREVVRAADARFLAAGFEALGAIVAQSSGITIMRAYANPAAHSYGVLYPQTYGESWQECYTAFDEDSSLTTSTVQGHFSRRALGIYHRASTAETVEALAAEHSRGVEILRARGLTPSPAPADLKSFAQAVDGFLYRESGF